MLTEFYLDENFFYSKCLEHNISAIHDFILTSWAELGILVVCNSELENFQSLVNLFPVKYRQRWINAISINSKYVHSVDLRRVDACSNFEDMTHFSETFQTCFTDDRIVSRLLGDETNKASCNTSGFEVLGASVASESLNFEKSRKFSASMIDKEAKIKDVWEDRFYGLAKYTKTITIIDRYIYERILQDVENGVASTSIKNFLGLISGFGKKYSLKIISCGGSEGSQKSVEVMNYFEKNILKSPCLAKLTLVSCNERYFMDYAHERYICFGDFVCQIGVGMQIFEKRKIPKTQCLIQRKERMNFQEIERASVSYQDWYESNKCIIS